MPLLGGIRIVDVIPSDSTLETAADFGTIQNDPNDAPESVPESVPESAQSAHKHRRRMKFDRDDVPDLDSISPNVHSKLTPTNVREFLESQVPSDADIDGALDKFGKMIDSGLVQDRQPLPSMLTWAELIALYREGYIRFDGDRLVACVDPDATTVVDDPSAISDIYPSGWRPADADYTINLRYYDEHPIDPKRYKMYTESDNGDIKINRAEIFRYIHDLRVIYDYHGHAYQWDLVRYRPVDDAYVRRLIRTVVPIGSLTERMISEIVAELKDSDTFDSVEIPTIYNFDGSYDGTILPFRNGWLNIDTGKWLKPVPFYSWVDKDAKGNDERRFMTYCLNVSYNPYIEPSAGSEWFRRLIPDDDTWRFVMEFFGSIMRLGGKSQPGFLIFQSEKGDTGKSAMYEAFAKILGPDLVMRFDLDDLNGKFIGSLIENKWALICGEIGSHDIGNDKRLKKIAGREELRVERKYVDGYTIKPDVGMIFASNGIPNFGDRSDGMRRRVYPVPMDQKMNWDDQIWDVMHSDESLSWLVNEIIRAHKARNGGKYTVSAEMQALRNTIFASTDSFYAYMSELCEADTLTPEIVQRTLVDRVNGDGDIDFDIPGTLGLLYDDYRKYCTEHSISNPLYEKSVSSRLREYDIAYDKQTVRDEFHRTTVRHFRRA